MKPLAVHPVATSQVPTLYDWYPYLTIVVPRERTLSLAVPVSQHKQEGIDHSYLLEVVLCLEYGQIIKCKVQQYLTWTTCKVSYLERRRISDSLPLPVF
jgi:hypothetical protein